MRMGYSVKLYPQAYRDLVAVYQRAYEKIPATEEALRELECLEEGILGLGNGFHRFLGEREENFPTGRPYVAEAGGFQVVFQVFSHERQVRVMSVRCYSGDSLGDSQRVKGQKEEKL